MESFRWNEREKSISALTQEIVWVQRRRSSWSTRIANVDFERSHRREEEREREGRRGRKTQLVVWTRSFEEGTGSAPLVGAETEKCRETAPRDSAVVFLYHVNLMRDRNGAQGLEVSRAGAILSIYRAVRRLSSSVPVFSSWWTPLIARSTSQRIVKNRVSSR